MITKKQSDFHYAANEYCGKIANILPREDSPHVSIAVAFDIKPTVGHYHLEFEEIYFVLDGTLELKFYDPKMKKTWEDEFAANELVVIPVGLHHKIIKASDKNRLCIITTPGWHVNDEYPSEVLG